MRCHRDSHHAFRPSARDEAIFSLLLIVWLLVRLLVRLLIWLLVWLLIRLLVLCVLNRLFLIVGDHIESLLGHIGGNLSSRRLGNLFS